MHSKLLSRIKLTNEDVTLSMLSGVALSVIFVWNIYPFLGSGQEYKDLVVGNLIWSDYDKDKEWTAFRLLLIFSVVFSLGISVIFQYLREKKLSFDFLSTTHDLFYIAWFPAIFWLGAALVRPDISPFIMTTSCIFVFLIVLIVLGLSRLHEKTEKRDLMDIGLSSILILVLTVFSILALAIPAGMYSLYLRNILHDKWILILAGSGVILTFSFIIINIYFSDSVEKIKNRFHLSLLLLQIPIPFLLFVFISKYYIYQGKVLTMYRSNGIAFIVFCLIALSLYMLFQKYKKLLNENKNGKNTSYKDVLSMYSLYPIAIYISWSQYIKVLGFEFDDFHIGEQLLPWQQIIDFGKIPYVDFIPIHGLMPLLYGGLNELFYGNTVATFPLAMGLLAAIAVAITFIAIYLFSGPIMALLLTPFIWSGIVDRFYFVIPALLVLSIPKITSRSKIWLSAWIIVCLFSISYNAAIGAGIAVGSLPLAIYMGWRAYKEERNWLKYCIAFLTCIAFLILALSPFREIVLGFFHYFIDNSSTNEIAYGMGLFQYNNHPEELGLGAIQFQWNLLRISWMLVALIAIVIFIRTLIIKQYDIKSKYFWLVVLLPITFFMIGEWVLGRIGGETLSRTGALSYIALLVFLPLMIIGFRSDPTRSVSILFIALIMGSVISVTTVPDFNVWLTKPFSNTEVDQNYILVSGKDIGLERLGDLFTQPKRIEELQNLKAAMTPFIHDEETFLDLSDHSALYFYLNMPVPVLYSAFYNAPDTKSQTRMIDQIKDNPPPVILIAPSINHDGGPASLRSYRLYRELIDSYVPEQIGEYTFLIRPDRINIDIIDDKNSSEKQMDILDNVFSTPDLNSIPNAWGRSWDLMKGRFTIIKSIKPTGGYNFRVVKDNTYRPIGENPYIFYELSQYNLSGKEIDHILLDYSCTMGTTGTAPILELYWKADNKSPSEKTVLRFSGSGSKALIPVGAQPRWRLAKHIDGLRVDFKDYGSCSELIINRLVLLKLNNIS